MTIDTPVRSRTAIVLACFFAAGTLRILLDDVVQGAPFTTIHLASLAALLAALAAGHYAIPALRAGAIAPGLLLLVIAASATAYVIVTAGMRNAVTATTKVAEAAKAGDDRRAAESEWKRLDAELTSLGTPRSTQAVRAAMDAVVGDGAGQVPGRAYRATRECTDITRDDSARACQPLLALRVEMAAAIRRREIDPQVTAARQRLEGMPPVAGPSIGYANAAAVLAALPFVTAPPPSIQGRLELLMPFSGVVIGELATIAFAWLGFGGPAPGAEGRHLKAQRKSSAGCASGQPKAQGKTRNRPRRTVRDRETTPLRRETKSLASRTVRVVADGPAQSAGPSESTRKSEAEADLLTLLALGQSVPSQRTLAERWQRPKQTVSDWLGEWEAAGLIPPRRTIGREKALLRA